MFYLQNNLHVLIMGGDARYLHVIRMLAQENITVYVIGYDHIHFNEINVQHVELESIDHSILNAIILPVAGTDTKGKVEVTYSDKSIYLTEQLLSCTPSNCVIYTGTSNNYLDHATAATNRKLVKLFARDDIAIYNSIPTAEGALKIAIEETDVTIHGSNVSILGFGRVGMTVARLFQSVGAHVSVAVRSSTAIARITEMGFTPVQLRDLKQAIETMDICINTIPDNVVDKTIISAMKPSMFIIDLASKPGGTDFNFAAKQGIKASHALGLPGKVASKSAGIIIANVLLSLLEERA